ARQAQYGALVAPTRWLLADGERAGCILWIGGWELLLGGDPKYATQYSASEIAMLDQSLRLILEEGGEGALALNWASLEAAHGTDLAARLDALGNSGEFETVQIKIGVAEREIRFVFVAAASQAARTASAPQAGRAAPAAAAARESRAARPSSPAAARIAAEASDSGDFNNLRHLLDVKIPLRIRLGSTRMNLEDVLRISPGAILELDRREDEPLEVLANGRVIARGEVVVVDERFGLRITEIGSSSDRIEAAG
ncbi:MAG TPA: flagellar motor switch protein FliN, partial [bacterium]|nr:flagellar motor switch protein FliN [bacterium]